MKLYRNLRQTDCFYECKKAKIQSRKLFLLLTSRVLERQDIHIEHHIRKSLKKKHKSKMVPKGVAVDSTSE